MSKKFKEFLIIIICLIFSIFGCMYQVTQQPDTSIAEIIFEEESE